MHVKVSFDFSPYWQKRFFLPFVSLVGINKNKKKFETFTSQVMLNVIYIPLNRIKRGLFFVIRGTCIRSVAVFFLPQQKKITDAKKKKTY